MIRRKTTLTITPSCYERIRRLPMWINVSALLRELDIIKKPYNAATFNVRHPWQMSDKVLSRSDEIELKLKDFSLKIRGRQ